MKVRFVFAVATSLLLSAQALSAETAEHLIMRARAYLGTEQALGLVTSIHYTGSLEGVERVPSPDDKTKLVTHTVKLPTEIIVQKPFQQRITLTRPESVDTTALDGYDAWNKVSSTKTPTQWRVKVLEPLQIKTLRANTWENLHFFLGLEKIGGTVQIAEESTIDGVLCTKVIFMHDAEVSFQRFFEKSTGRLVKTITESGTEIREQGELITDGVRFPRQIVQKETNGQVTTITFDKVELNQVFPADQFAVPSMQASE